MRIISRRNFLGTTALGAGALTLTSTAFAQTKSGGRMAPLDGIERENIKITDVKMTILSYRFKEEEQWYTAGRVAWKSDTMILQVFTDQGIVGIGEGSPYGDLLKMKDIRRRSSSPV